MSVAALHDSQVTAWHDWRHGQARCFLHRLDPEAEAFTFQTFDDTPAKRRDLACVKHGDFDALAATIDGLNARRAGVFVTVAATDGKGRQAHNVERVRAVFVDLDGAPLAPVLQAGLEPHIVTESSPGRWHCYWLTDDCALDQFELVQRALARRFGGDPSVHDLSRVMRVPGFRHWKGDACTARLLDEIGTTAPQYALAQIVATLGLDLSTTEKPRLRPIGEGKIEPGDRHSHLFAMGRSMVRRGSASATVHAALAAENAARCDPPLPNADIEYLADRAFKAKHAEGWQEQARGNATGAGAVRRATANAKPPEVLPPTPPPYSAPADDFASRLAALAAMPALEYDRVRENAAAQLGVRVSTLDVEVGKKRAEVRNDNGAGQALQFAQLEPWPDPVDSAALLAELADSPKRHMVLPKHAEIVLALWVVFTYTIDAADAAPILAIVSPEKRCGKSTLLDWLTRLVRNALAAASVSPAAMFRAIEKWRPTLLIDEADTFLRENEELRGLLNSGHTRSMAFVVRAEGDTHQVKQFSTWGAKAIALIGKLPDTLADRSITIEMRRKMPSERVYKLRGDVERRYLEEVSRRCQRFAVDTLPTLNQADPKIPDGLNDRAADSWAPLLAIADFAGGEWPATARAAASVLCGATPDGDSLKVELLRDVRVAFIEREQDRLASTELADAVATDSERPWAEYNRGKPMTVRQLARLLNAFGILSGTVRLADGKTLKGYKLEDFEDVFARYLPPFDPSQRHTQALAWVVTNKSNVTNESCDGSLLASQTSTGAGCNGVTDGNPHVTRVEGIGTDEGPF
jgi:hypothetical protein